MPTNAPLHGGPPPPKRLTTHVVASSHDTYMHGKGEGKGIAICAMYIFFPLLIFPPSHGGIHTFLFHLFSNQDSSFLVRFDHAGAMIKGPHVLGNETRQRGGG